jgi:hypothetical protein
LEQGIPGQRAWAFAAFLRIDRYTVHPVINTLISQSGKLSASCSELSDLDCVIAYRETRKRQRIFQEIEKRHDEPNLQEGHLNLPSIIADAYAYAYVHCTALHCSSYFRPPPDRWCPLNNSESERRTISTRSTLLAFSYPIRSFSHPYVHSSLCIEEAAFSPSSLASCPSLAVRRL